MTESNIKALGVAKLVKLTTSFQSSEGNVAVVEYLMRQGAGIHMRDRNNDTPLLCAIKAGHRDVVRSLVSCGAHLQKGSLELGKDQCISWMPNQM